MSTEPSVVDELHCPGCGYNLFGIDSEKCPECGLTIDRSIAGDSKLPWFHRKEIGNYIAFFQTVALATFRPTKLADEMNRPVNLADAMQFRHICVLIAAATSSLGAYILIQSGGGPIRALLDMTALEQLVTCVLVSAGIWVFFLAVTGFPSLFFHPGHMSVRRQNRAIALSYYAASAPWLGVIPIGVVMGMFAVSVEPDMTILSVVIMVVLLLTILLTLYSAISATVRLLGSTTQCGASRKALMALLTPVAWILLCALFIIGPPLALGYLAVMIYSLHFL